MGCAADVDTRLRGYDGVASRYDGVVSQYGGVVSGYGGASVTTIPE